MAPADQGGGLSSLRAAESTLEPHHRDRQSRTSPLHGNVGLPSSILYISVAYWVSLSAGSISSSFTDGQSASLSTSFLEMNRRHHLGLELNLVSSLECDRSTDRPLDRPCYQHSSSRTIHSDLKFDRQLPFRPR